MATTFTYGQLATMTKEAVFAYERSLGFIAPVFDAITHADNVREKTTDACLPLWSATWTFDNAKQREYFRMVSEKRGWFMYDIPRNKFGLRLESRLIRTPACAPNPITK